MHFDQAKRSFVRAFAERYGYEPDVADPAPPSGPATDPHSYSNGHEWLFTDTLGRKLGYYRFDSANSPAGVIFLSDETDDDE